MAQKPPILDPEVEIGEARPRERPGRPAGWMGRRGIIRAIETAPFLLTASDVFMGSPPILSMASMWFKR